jgi:hypothetical protein
MSRRFGGEYVMVTSAEVGGGAPVVAAASSKPASTHLGLSWPMGLGFWKWASAVMPGRAVCWSPWWYLRPARRRWVGSPPTCPRLSVVGRLAAPHLLGGVFMTLSVLPLLDHKGNLRSGRRIARWRRSSPWRRCLAGSWSPPCTCWTHCRPPPRARASERYVHR